MEELHQVERRGGGAVALRQHDDRRRADEAAVRLQRIEVERDVRLRRRQDAAGGAARQIGVELVALEHAAAVFIHQLAQRDSGRREMHARLLHPSGNGERARAFAPMAALGGEPRRAFLHDLAHPVHRLHVVLERGTAEEPDLRHVRRAQARHAALALERLDHRRLFAADISARAAPQMDRRQRAGRIRLQ